MSRRTICTVVGLVGLMICLAAQPARADALEVVVKYGGKLVKVANGTGMHEVFQGLPMPAGQAQLFAVPNSDETKPTYAPDVKIEAMVKAFQAGDLVDIVYVPSKSRSGAFLVQTAKAYTMLPGENEPRAFKFVETFPHKQGPVTVYAITLSSFTIKSIFLIPTHRDANGDMVPDDIIKGIADHLHAGDLVYAVTVGNGNGGTIKMLAPWKNHFTGKFVKLDPAATVDSDNDTGPAVEITGPDGKLVTALIPGSMPGKKWMPDQSILGPARGLKADADVDFITADSGDGRVWLVTIAKSKPASAAHGGMPAAHAGVVRNGN